MKKIVILLAFILLSITGLKAQTSFSCTEREYCYWNPTTEKYGNCTSYEESSLFVMNKAETMFTHTIESIKSTYYVDSKEYLEKKDVYTYNVTSDVGNKYYYVFDPKNKEIRAVYTTDGKTIMVVFKVKAMF